MFRHLYYVLFCYSWRHLFGAKLHDCHSCAHGRQILQLSCRFRNTEIYHRFWTPRRAKVAFRVSVSRLRKIRALPCGCYAHDFAKTHRRRALPPPLNKHAVGGGAAPCYVSRQHAALAIRPPAPINIRGTNAPFHTRRGQLDQTLIPLASLLA